MSEADTDVSVPAKLQGKPAQVDVYAAVAQASGLKRPNELSEETGRSVDSVNGALKSLLEAGLVEKPEHGKYRLSKGSAEETKEDDSLHHIPEVEVDAGPGREPALQEVNGGFYVPERYIRQIYGVRPEKLCVMRVRGDSMKDTLQPGQRVVSARWEGEQLRDGAIYGIQGPTGFMVKRLRFGREDGEDVIRICSDNKTADQWWVTTDEFEAEYTPLAWAIEVGQKL